MEQPSKMTPKDFFLNLGIVASIYTTAFAFLTLMFEMINRVFTDPLSVGYYVYGYYSSGIRFAIASLVIVLPLCIILSVINSKLTVSVPEKRKLPFRRWLSYLTLFLSSLAVVIDLIVLINLYLGGEVGVRFVCKVVSVLVVSLIIFVYFWQDLKSDGLNRRCARIFTIAISSIILIAIISGFLIIGSPTTQRSRLFDQRREGDLQSIQSQIVNFWQKKGVIPSKLSELNDSISGYVVPSDPQTGKNYEYVVSDATQFRLCATFSLSTEEINGKDYMTRNSYPKSYATAPDYMLVQDVWTHDAGDVCFDRTIDVELYTLNKNII